MGRCFSLALSLARARDSIAPGRPLTQGQAAEESREEDQHRAYDGIVPQHLCVRGRCSFKLMPTRGWSVFGRRRRRRRGIETCQSDGATRDPLIMSSSRWRLSSANESNIPRGVRQSLSKPAKRAERFFNLVSWSGAWGGAPGGEGSLAHSRAWGGKIMVSLGGGNFLIFKRVWLAFRFRFGKIEYFPPKRASFMKSFARVLHVPSDPGT